LAFIRLGRLSGLMSDMREVRFAPTAVIPADRPFDPCCIAPKPSFATASRPRITSSTLSTICGHPALRVGYFPFDEVAGGLLAKVRHFAFHQLIKTGCVGIAEIRILAIDRLGKNNRIAGVILGLLIGEKYAGRKWLPLVEMKQQRLSE
jgi:hypothetical protein